MKVHKPGPRPHRAGRGRDSVATRVALALALALLGVAGVAYGGRQLRQRLVVQRVLETSLREPPPGLQLDMQQHAADEMLLRQVVEECSRRQDTVLHLDSQRRLVVTRHIDPHHCPLMDIMLRGAERGVGMCTDVALYMIGLGARVIPMPADLEAYDASCGAQTARLFLESMYGEFISSNKHVLHIQLLNSEHMWTQDAAMHARMQLFLCKTRLCLALMQQHIVDKGYWASVWFMGHTSSDPGVGVSGDMSAQVAASVARSHPSGFAVHVKGKSGLKQTKVVLDCWASQPDFPPLVVVGRASQEELSPAARAASNIVFYPPLVGAAAGEGGEAGGGEELLIEPERLQGLQAAATMHVCPSVREGFGHYLNEARAVGGLVVTVAHPPMDELITPATGLLVPTVFTMSERGTELGRLTHLNGHVSADGLCATVKAGWALPQQEAAAKRAAAAAAYRSEKAAFLDRLQQLKAFLQDRSAVAAAAAGAGSSSSAAAAALAARIAGLAAASGSGGPGDAAGAAAAVAAAGGRRMGPGLDDTNGSV